MRMGYVKRNCSNAGKISVSNFKKLQDDCLADIQAETLMHEISDDLILNWDQTGLSLVPIGERTMHQASSHCSSCCYPERRIPVPSGYLSRQDGEVSSQSGNPIRGTSDTAPITGQMKRQ